MPARADPADRGGPTAGRLVTRLEWSNDGGQGPAESPINLNPADPPGLAAGWIAGPAREVVPQPGPQIRVAPGCPGHVLARVTPVRPGRIVPGFMVSVTTCGRGD